MMYLIAITCVVCCVILGVLKGNYINNNKSLFNHNKPWFYTWCKWFLDGLAPFIIIIILSTCTIAVFLKLFNIQGIMVL